MEIDYADLGKVMAEIEAAVAPSIKAKIAAFLSVAAITNDENQPATTTKEEEPTPGFYIDTKPSPVRDLSTSTNDIAVEHPGTGILGEPSGKDDDDDDDEIIVYVAPNPRNGKLPSTPTQSSPTDAKTPTGPVAAPMYEKTYHPPPAPALLPEPEPELWPEPEPEPLANNVIPAPSPAPALAFKDFSFSLLSSSPRPTHRVRWPQRTAHRKAERSAMFALFGAMHAEATLRELDPRRAEQRRGDSDVDWGGSTSEVEDSEQDGGMLVDQDIELDAMTAFVRSMGVGGLAHVSAGDLEDEARIRLEDADEDRESSDDGDGDRSDDEDTELELAADGVQGIPAADGEVASTRSFFAEDGHDDDDTSEDDEVTPKRSFQARLRRIRDRNAGRPIKAMMRDELEQELEVDDDLDSDSDSDIDDDESIIARMQVL